MTLLEAVKERHSVRKYADKAIEADKIAVLQAAVADANRSSGLHIQLVLNEPRAFSEGLFKYGVFSGVSNYWVMAGPKGKDEEVGYYGERLVLLAQTLGLHTCWVGLTYKKIPGTYVLEKGEQVYCVISLGYGLNAGVPHPLRPAEKFYETGGRPAPAWFLDGVAAAVLAPTAVHQQKFRFFLHENGQVSAKALFSWVGYAQIDLGIAKCHFELGAGKENFSWA